MPHITPSQKSRDSASHPHLTTVTPVRLTIRRVIRIIFTIPVFAIVAFLSVVFNDAAIYLKPIEDLYEAFALAGFFLLLCTFVEKSDEARQTYFSTSGTTKHYIVSFYNIKSTHKVLADRVEGSDYWSVSISSCHARSACGHRDHPGYGLVLRYFQQTILCTYLGKSFLLQ